MRWSIVLAFLLLVPSTQAVPTEKTCVIPKEIEVVCRYVRLGPTTQGLDCIDRKGKTFTVVTNKWQT